MGILRFSDGVNINTSGALRIKELSDGWYVVGEDMMIPCTDKEDAVFTLLDMKRVSAESET
ncbi:MAG: hypothetical protein GY847_01475 [Proteobacteria bacterium]|nr:hypothetical protein [Pseudomonadota bacterium]